MSPMCSAIRLFAAPLGPLGPLPPARATCAGHSCLPGSLLKVCTCMDVWMEGRKYGWMNVWMDEYMYV